MDEEMYLENALFPWLDDPSGDECHEPPDEDDEEYDPELDQDRILEQQELEDFEGLDPFEGSYDW